VGWIFADGKVLIPERQFSVLGSQFSVLSERQKIRIRAYCGSAARRDRSSRIGANFLSAEYCVFG
jgi:hypothetical protein